MKAVSKNKKRTLPPEEKVNQNILRLAYIVVFLFLTLIGYVAYFLTVSRENVINNTYNARLESFSKRVERGSILSNDKTVLAMTELEENGKETRSYPYGSLFSHVVGYSTRGKTGLETLGNFYLLTSHMNLVNQAVAELSGRKKLGDHIVTSLDIELQQLASDALGDRRGAVVVMEPDTGRILAMVSKPDFDPNTIQESWETLISAENHQAQLMNRATQGLYPPGSSFKIVTLLEYIREHPEDYEDYQFDCNGYYKNGEYTLQCYHGTAHGSQNLEEAFANSCNGAFASIGVELEPGGLKRTAEELLFNKEQPVPLAYSKSRFAMRDDADTWEILQTSIGQGLTQMTPMHNAMITSAIANGGILMNPYLIDRVENRAGNVVKQFSPTIYKTLMSQEEARILTDMMRKVVTQGTGSALRTKAYEAAGKTGSAQFEDGNESHAWFTGFAPVDNPQIVVSVVVEKGGSGGATAAPIAKRIFDVYLSR